MTIGGVANQGIEIFGIDIIQYERHFCEVKSLSLVGLVNLSLRGVELNRIKGLRVLEI